jgi:hypothetical protein
MQLNDDALFCVRCGVKQTSMNNAKNVGGESIAQSVNFQPKANSKQWLYIIISIAVILIVTLIMVSGLGGSGNKVSSGVGTGVSGIGNGRGISSGVDIFEVWENGQRDYAGEKIVTTGSLYHIANSTENYYTVAVYDPRLGSSSLTILGFVTDNTAVFGNMVKFVDVKVTGTIIDPGSMSSGDFDELQSKGYVIVELESIERE